MKYDGDVGRFVYRSGHDVEFKHPLAVEPSGTLLADHSKKSNGHHGVVEGPIKCKNFTPLLTVSEDGEVELPRCLVWPGKAGLLLTRNVYDESKVTCYQ